MGNLFVGKILLSIAQKPARKPVETELAPIRPGAWAAWAKASADEQAPAAETKVEGTTRTLVPSTFPR
jgi:hypothetical protein